MLNVTEAVSNVSIAQLDFTDNFLNISDGILNYMDAILNVSETILNICRCNIEYQSEYFLCLINVFTLILNVSMLSYFELNISEAVMSVLRDMNFTEAIPNVLVQAVLMFQMLY